MPSEALRLILTKGSSAVATQLLEKPTSLVKAIQQAAKTSGFDAGQLVHLLARAGVATTKTLLEDPEKLAGSIVVLTQVEHVTSEALRLILTKGSSAIATQLLEEPVSLAKAIRTAVKMSDFDAGWLVQLLTYTASATTKTVWEDPEKFASSITVMTQVEGVSLAQLLLTRGSRTVIAQLIEEPVILTNAIQKAASISGHDAWKFVSPLAYAGDVVVQELLGDPQKLIDSIGRKRKVTEQSQPQRQVVEVGGGGEGGGAYSSEWVPANNGWNEWGAQPSGRTYYHNPSTGITQWDKPHGSVSVVQRMQQQERLQEAQEQQQQMQALLREQTRPRKVTDDQIVVAIKEILVTRPDVSSAQVTNTINEVNKL